MWRSSGVLYLPYIYIQDTQACLLAYSCYINKTAQNEQFLSKHGVWLQRESWVNLSDIYDYVWRMFWTVDYTCTNMIYF